MKFEIIPAIDLKDKKCVQLIGGKPNKKSFETNDPIKIAHKWTKKGAERLHIIDLDGAISNKRINEDTVFKISSMSKIPIQYGGGIRTKKDARKFLSKKIDKLILGTAAIESKKIIQELINEFGPKNIIIAADAKNGKVMIKGWTKSTEISAIDFINDMEKLGASQFLFTNINKEGKMKGVDINQIEEIVNHTTSYIIIAGGISSLEDIKLIAQKGANAVVIGSAIYNKKIDLSEAIRLFEKDQ